MTPSPDPRRLAANVRCIRVMNFTWMFMLIMPVAVPFFGSVGLTPGQVLEVQAIFGLTIVLFEVPTGYLSDVIGRKGCLVLAGVLHGMAFSLLAGIEGYWDVVCYEVLAALAVCLYSGTDVALLYESLEGLGEKAGRRRALGQRLFWMQVGETSAAILGGWIAVVSLREVAFWNAVVGWLPFLAALPIYEVPRAKMDRRKHLENLGFIWRELFVVSPLVRQILVNLIAYGLSTLLVVWIFQAYWEHMEISIAFFGYLWAGYNLTVAVVGRAAHLVEERFGAHSTLLSIAVLPVLGYSVMALTALFPGEIGACLLGILAGVLFQVGRGLTQVVLKDELNGRVKSELRATANSVSSLGVRLGYALLGPFVGILVDGSGYPAALSFGAALYAIFGAALALPLARRLRAGPASA